MLFISRLKLRNFKSFKFMDVPLPRTFLCLAGPNGSGKSNFTDAIRFVLGETSLKSLRAKKVRDLIFADGRAAEVTITFESEPNGSNKKEKYEIKRAIREDGKILYKLNDRKTTRTSILDTMKKYNLDGSGRNVIVQGEVQRIIGMSGKERRSIIDSVAGISDFEEKKKEAMRELDTVDARIREAHLVIGERNSFLAELEREKETALKYVDSKKKLTNAKATLLKVESERLEKEFEDVTKLTAKIQYTVNNKEEELREIDEKIKGIENDKYAITKELQLKQQTAGMIKKIEELKASVSSKQQLVEDKEEQLKKIEAETKSSIPEINDEKSKLQVIDKEIQQLKKELEKYEIEQAALSPSSESSPLNSLKSNLRENERKLQEMREQAIKLEAEIKSKREMIDVKSQELENLNKTSLDSESVNVKSDIARLQKEGQKIAKEIEDLFRQTKEANAEISELDRKFVEIREKSSYLRLRVSPALANPALKFISDIKDKNSVPGIYGTVAELIKFENKHANAVEAAAGSRLLYVVVENADVATKLIDRLRKANAGRATFIPLREIKVNSGNVSKGADPIINFVSFDQEVRKAVEFVFGDTLLVEDSSEAKKIGIGSARMVTLTGDLFERVGIITGGKSENSILATAQLRKIDEEADLIKKSRTELVNQLYSIREREGELRSVKSEIEVKIKSMEIQVSMHEEEKKKNEQQVKRAEDLKKEIDAMSASVKTSSQQLDSLSSELKIHEKKLEQLHQSLSQHEEKEKQLSEASKKKETELASSVSSLRATIHGKVNELAIRKKELHAKEENLVSMEKEKSSIMEKINAMKRQVINEQKDLESQELQISKQSKEIEKLFEENKKFEEQLQAIGKQRGEKRLDVDKLNKDLNQASVKKATIETRLTDVKAEFDAYKNAEFMDAEKDELISIIKESEQLLESLGNVNMAAIEMYDKKKNEIAEIQERLNKLSEEHAAVVEMINGIEHRKKEAFFETFYAVSDNFKKMFSHISIGEGYLYLDKPNEPFESGLFIKLKRHNREHSLDSLSGGESSLVALMFIFALQFFKPAPFYILDEVDAALDKENSRNLAQLIKQMSNNTQFMVVSHNDMVMSLAEAVLGVTKVEGISKLVGVKLESTQAA